MDCVGYENNEKYENEKMFGSCDECKSNIWKFPSIKQKRNH